MPEKLISKHAPLKSEHEIYRSTRGLNPGFSNRPSWSVRTVSQPTEPPRQVGKYFSSIHVWISSVWNVVIMCVTVRLLSQQNLLKRARTRRPLTCSTLHLWSSWPCLEHMMRSTTRKWWQWTSRLQKHGLKELLTDQWRRKRIFFRTLDSASIGIGRVDWLRSTQF